MARRLELRSNALHEVEAPNPRKKKPLTEIEIALKREETARKRRNLTEKKLEDEKVGVYTFRKATLPIVETRYVRPRQSTVSSRSNPVRVANGMHSRRQRTSPHLVTTP